MSRRDWVPPTRDVPPAPPPAADPPPANPLADDIRGIARLHPTEMVGAANDLADQVERYAAEPAEHELDTAGLDPEQEIRADAVTAAARVLAGQHYPTSGRVLDIAEDLAEWIRDGVRPDTKAGATCTCRRERSIAEPGQPLMEVRNPDCPTHGNRLESS